MISFDFSKEPVERPISYPFLWRNDMNKIVSMRVRSRMDVRLSHHCIGTIDEDSLISDEAAWESRLTLDETVSLRNVQ